MLVTGAAEASARWRSRCWPRRASTWSPRPGDPETHDYLKALGARARSSIAQSLQEKGPSRCRRSAGPAPSTRSAAITLVNVLAQTKYGRGVAACGLAGGMDLPGSVAPFILRGVSLLGIDSVQCPHPASGTRPGGAWHSDLDRGKLAQMTREIGLDEVIPVAGTILEGRVRGRIVVKIG